MSKNDDYTIANVNKLEAETFLKIYMPPSTDTIEMINMGLRDSTLNIAKQMDYISTVLNEMDVNFINLLSSYSYRHNETCGKTSAMKAFNSLLDGFSRTAVLAMQNLYRDSAITYLSSPIADFSVENYDDLFYAEEHKKDNSTLIPIGKVYDEIDFKFGLGVASNTEQNHFDLVYFGEKTLPLTNICEDIFGIKKDQAIGIYSLSTKKLEPSVSLVDDFIFNENTKDLKRIGHGEQKFFGIKPEEGSENAELEVRIKLYEQYKKNFQSISAIHLLDQSIDKAQNQDVGIGSYLASEVERAQTLIQVKEDLAEFRKKEQATQTPASKKISPKL